MAVRDGLHVWIAKGVLKSTWSGLLNGDTGAPLYASALPDRTIQVKGTFGAGGSLTMEGSNDDGTTYHAVNDSRGEGNALTFTAADMRMASENPEALRPNVTAGDGTTSLVVIMISKSTKR